MAKINANYEAMYILDPSLNEEAVAALVAKFKAVVEANGTVSEVDEWGKRRLAYPINDLMEGYYVLMTFNAAAAIPAELDRIFRITDGVMHVPQSSARINGERAALNKIFLMGRLTRDPELRRTQTGPQASSGGGPGRATRPLASPAPILSMWWPGGRRLSLSAATSPRAVWPWWKAAFRSATGPTRRAASRRSAE